MSENVACKMTFDNLATVFGPTVVGYSSSEPTMNQFMMQTKLQQLVNLMSVCLSVCLSDSTHNPDIGHLCFISVCYVMFTSLMRKRSLSTKRDPKYPLHHLLPPMKVSSSQMVLWPTYLQLPLIRTTHYGRDFIPYCIFYQINFNVLLCRSCLFAYCQ